MMKRIRRVVRDVKQVDTWVSKYEPRHYIAYTGTIQLGGESITVIGVADKRESLQSTHWTIEHDTDS